MDEELENPTTNNQSQQEIPNIVLTLNVNDVNLVLNACGATTELDPELLNPEPLALFPFTVKV